MKLPERPFVAVNFRRELPGFLAGRDEAKPAYIEIQARPAGQLNAALMARINDIELKKKILEARLEDEKDGGTRLQMEHDGWAEIGLDTFAAIYDTCVIGWKTDMLDDGQPMAVTRDSFLGLCDCTVPEIVLAMSDFREDVRKAGAAAIMADEEMEKNS